MLKHIFFFILSTSVLVSFQGELISHEFIEEFEVNEVQIMLNNQFGNLAPEALYDISMYKIIYNTIDPDGNIAKIYLSVKPSTHSQMVLNDLNQLQN